MPDVEKFIKGLKCCTKKLCIYKDTEKECPYSELCGEYEDSFEDCTTALSKDALALMEKLDVEPEELEQALTKAKEYDHLLHLAKAMHTWIFLNTVDEQAVYDELGFTDEDNALLGSIGRPMVIGRVKQEDSDNDLISRKAAIDYLMTNMGWRDEDGYEVDDADEKRAIITDLVNGIPAIDAVPVVRARWIATKIPANTTGHGGIGQDKKNGWLCSNCRCAFDAKLLWCQNYCPNCGAKMDGDGDG